MSSHPDNSQPRPDPHKPTVATCRHDAEALWHRLQGLLLADPRNAALALAVTQAASLRDTLAALPRQ